ncbi:hypothetical protein [Arthrobacter castelli]|uniref:hypothetical protein n=1 Tax=Arthrobacter castelli TaxID=271431 RepID=UPI000413668F|nr:hypothetical protein [Arthrobacter castelli]
MAIHEGRYKASESASSKHPGDWGRAMARAMAGLASQAAKVDGGAGHEDLYGEDLHLVIVETDDGVQITLSWDPEEE